MQEIYQDPPEPLAQRSCNVVAEDCKCPPGCPKSWFMGRITTCFACGLDVCVACSRRRKYSRFGRKRICLQCVGELEKEILFDKLRKK